MISSAEQSLRKHVTPTLAESKPAVNPIKRRAIICPHAATNIWTANKKNMDPTHRMSYPRLDKHLRVKYPLNIDNVQNMNDASKASKLNPIEALRYE